MPASHSMSSSGGAAAACVVDEATHGSAAEAAAAANRNNGGVAGAVAAGAVAVAGLPMPSNETGGETVVAAPPAENASATVANGKPIAADDAFAPEAGGTASEVRCDPLLAFPPLRLVVVDVTGASNAVLVARSNLGLAGKRAAAYPAASTACVQRVQSIL